MPTQYNGRLSHIRMSWGYKSRCAKEPGRQFLAMFQIVRMIWGKSFCFLAPRLPVSKLGIIMPPYLRGML